MQIKRSILFSTVCILEGFFYFYSWQLRRLCRMRKDSHSIEIIKANNSSEQILESVIDIETICVYGKSIYMLQTSGQSLIEYNIEANVFYEYPIEGAWKAWGNFAGVAIYKDKIYIFARNKDLVLCFDTKTKEITKHFFRIDKDGLESVYGCVLQEGQKASLFDWNSNRVLEFDLEILSHQIYSLPQGIQGGVVVMGNKDDLYVMDNDVKLFHIEARRKNVELIADLHGVAEEVVRRPFSRVLITEVNIWILPNTTDKIYVISKKDGLVEEYKNYPKDFTYLAPSTWTKYYGYCEDAVHYYFACRSANYILSIDKINGAATWIKPGVIDDFLWNKTLLESKKCVSEKEMTLNDYLLTI